jgi:parallel beta helix pectate lyase-like protein
MKKTLLATFIALTGTALFAILPHNEIPTNKLVAVPTFEAASLYFKTAVKPASCKTEFREKNSDKWQKALDLVYSSEDKMLRGSIVWLKENTEYEARLSFEKNDKKEIHSVNFKTWSSEVPVKKTVNIKDLPMNGTLTIKDKGTKDAWIKYTAPEGFIVKGELNDKAAISITDAEYIILENLTIEGGHRFGINVVNSQNIRIINCDISGWGRVGKQDLLKDGKYYTKSGRVNMDGGINIKNSGNMLVERCYIHDPRGRANSWKYSHPAGPEAITVRSTGGVVLRYNDFIGSDPHRWNDAVEGSGNGLKDGGFYRDSDIYGNMFAFGNDDGIEIDGGQINIRVWQNKFEGFLCAISTTPCLLGPSYSFKNLIVNLGDESGHSNTAFKNGHKTRLGQVFFFNNTVCTNSNGYENSKAKKDPGDKRLKGTTRNNLYYCKLSANPKFPMKNDFDYDLFWSGNHDNDLEAMVTFNHDGLEKNAVFAKPEFINSEGGNSALKPDSKGVDQGTTIDNFVETYTGKTPDIGAFEQGEDIPLPYRPIPVFLDKYQLNFNIDNGEGEQEGSVTVEVKSSKPYGEQFNVRKNKVFDWFTVEPLSGILKNGEIIQFKVKLNPDKMEKIGDYRGLFLIRQKNGYSRPVTVYAKLKDNSKIKQKGKDVSIYLEAEKPAGEQTFKSVDDKHASDGKCVFLEPENPQRQLGKKGLEYQFDIPEDGKFQILLRVRSEEPVGSHDSVFLSVDGDEPKPYHLHSMTEWTWSGGNRNWKSGRDEKGRVRSNKSFSLIELKKGTHTVKIFPREAIYLDLISVSNEPGLLIYY